MEIKTFVLGAITGAVAYGVAGVRNGNGTLVRLRVARKLDKYR
jgi:hypothetical protein